VAAGEATAAVEGLPGGSDRHRWPTPAGQVIITDRLYALLTGLGVTRI
jgi:hypothetical protein